MDSLHVRSLLQKIEALPILYIREVGTRQEENPGRAAYGKGVYPGH